ncbi:MAG: hypothetical protein L0I93_04605 [Atopostipes suicloacalis]|nr:hypothetical protein [Atopostipes suicloacalis]
MRQVKQNFKMESFIRIILAIVGILTFIFSAPFAWGFILAGIISKENIHLETKEGWILLLLITGVMSLALYFLLDNIAILGFISSTISYFLIRKLLSYTKNA